jgi:osmoprotectant transport system permease protein
VAFDRVTFFLVAVALAGVLGLGFVGFSPNRILTPKAIALWNTDAPAWAALMGAGFALLIAGALWRARRTGQIVTLAGAVLLLIADFATAGAAASHLLAGATSSAARVSLGGAFWVVLVAAGLAIAESLRRYRKAIWLHSLVGFGIVAVLAALAMRGWFDDLSLVHEWSIRREEYNLAFIHHVVLVLAALTLALVIGVPLGLMASSRPKRSGHIFSVLSLVQTVPSIALFGLLIGPLTMLSDWLPFLRSIGVRGIGFTPALIALTLYGLLPIARNTEAGLKSVPASAIDTARGMGMTPFQILFWVSIPLASPVLLAGLRIVTVQLIGLTVVAALIGAGGFGSFVFIGLGQTATDLVLLGALSAILLALAADMLLRLLTLAVIRAVTP